MPNELPKAVYAIIMEVKGEMFSHKVKKKHFMPQLDTEINRSWKAEEMIWHWNWKNG